MRAPLLAVSLALVLIACGVLRAQDSSSTPRPAPAAGVSEEAGAPKKVEQVPSAADVHRAIDLGVEYLLGIQRKDGSWGGVKDATFTSSFGNLSTYHSWTVATTALVTLAMLEQGRTEETLAAAKSGLGFIIENADLKRPAEWDVDNNWGFVYGIRTLAVALLDERIAGTELEGPVREAAQTMLRGLAKYQSPRGGWGYYADPDAAWNPEWATSFTTAVSLIGLRAAKDAGLEVDEKLIQTAVRAVEVCKLPNGAYAYTVSPTPPHLRLESIDQVKGSLGRIQVCNVARLCGGSEVPADEIEWGLGQFFEHHKFLDVARNKPIPHEAFYANAAYFYLFGHYYAAHAIESLPEERRGKWARQLREPILKTQQADGSMWDFWIAGTTKAYGTAFGVMSLGRTLETEPEK